MFGLHIANDKFQMISLNHQFGTETVSNENKVLMFRVFITGKR